MVPLRLWLSLVIVAPAACQSIPSTSVVSQPLPTGAESTVRVAEEIGQAIYEQDEVSAKATDVMYRDHVVQTEKRTQGWITLKNNDGWLIRFIGKTGDNYVAYHDVKFPLGRLLAGERTSLDPPQPLPADQLSMVQARELAMRGMSMRCSDRYNTVILPADVAHAEGWVVYLLAATTTPGEVMIGGHSKIELSSDGTEVKRVIPLSKSCLRIPLSLKADHQTVGIMTTHIISDTPIETHVYLSLLHKMPVFVTTDIGLWKVENGKIQLQTKR